MAKFPTLEIPKDFRKYMRYKWEFLRRNKEYIRDWEKLLRIPNDMPREKASDFANKLRIKWRIFEPSNPAATFDKLMDHGDMRFEFERLNPYLYANRPIMELDAWELGGKFTKGFRNHINETGELTIKLDLNYSKNRLIKEFKMFIEDWKRLYEHGHKELLKKRFLKEKNIPEFSHSEDLRKEFEEVYQKELKQRIKKHKKKYHIDNFDDYLQVYDLRESGKSWSDIKTALNLNSSQTARNHYNAACDLIKKGVDYYVK